MPDTNTQQSLVDMLTSECSLTKTEAEKIGTNMVRLASTHLMLEIREMNQGLSDSQTRHRDLIQTWFECMADALPGITAAHFNGDVRATTVLLSLDSGASNSFSGKWRVPVQMPASPSTALIRPIQQDIDIMLAAKEARLARSITVGIDNLHDHEKPLPF
jgi:hypothetical protein